MILWVDHFFSGVFSGGAQLNRKDRKYICVVTGGEESERHEEMNVLLLEPRHGEKICFCLLGRFQLEFILR